MHTPALQDNMDIVKDMAIPQCVLLSGEVYRCERALAARHEEIVGAYPDTERHTLFGDEIDLGSLKDELHSDSLFALGRHFIIRHLEKMKKNGQRALADLIKSSLPAGTFITLLAEERLRSGSLSKTVKGNGTVKQFPKPKGSALKRAAVELLEEHGLKLASREVERLLATSNGELLRILNEARKLRSFSPNGQPSSQSIARLSFTAGEGSIYPVLDRLGEGNLPAAFMALRELHEDPGRVFYALIRRLTRLLMVRLLLDEGTSPAKIASTIGAPSWLAKRFCAQAKSHSSEELTTALDRGIELDAQIKGGKIRPEDAVSVMILSATTPPRRAPERIRKIRPFQGATG